MNIGVDIDNVLSNFNEVLLKEFITHDKELRNQKKGDTMSTKKKQQTITKKGKIIVNCPLSIN